MPTKIFAEFEQAVRQLLWEHGDEPAGEVHEALHDIRIWVLRAYAELAVLMVESHVAPKHMPPVEMFLPSLMETLDQPVSLDPVDLLKRLLATQPPAGELIGLPVKPSIRGGENN